MSAMRLTVKFDGKRLDEGRIDVRELAPALLAIGELISHSNRTLHPDAPPIKVEAVATAVGSFEIDIDVILSGWALIRDIFTSADVDAGLKLVETIGLIATPVMGGLIGLLRVLKGSRVQSASQIDGDRTIVRFLDENGSLTSVIVPSEVLRLYQEAKVQRELGRLMDVLASPEIDAITFSSPHPLPAPALPVVLTKNDREYVIREPLPPVLVNEAVTTMALSIRTLAFAEGNKWRLYDGQNTISATIEDEDFRRRVDDSLERFAKDDVLICEVRTVQTQSEAGLKTDYAIVRVVEHKTPPTQIAIKFTPSD